MTTEVEHSIESTSNRQNVTVDQQNNAPETSNSSGQDNKKRNNNRNRNRNRRSNNKSGSDKKGKSVEQNGNQKDAGTGENNKKKPQNNRKNGGQNEDTAEDKTSENKKPQNSRPQSNPRNHPRDPRRIVQKPKPKYDTRTSEINQLKKGYTSLKASADNTVFSIAMKPSDPDFPYELEALLFDLYVPAHYPQVAPYISVKNTDIPKGYSGNVEVGFKEVAQSNLGKLSLMNMTLQLDKQLEEFLTREKQQTIKIIRGGPNPAATNPGKKDGSHDNKDNNQQKKKKPTSFTPSLSQTFIPGHIKQERENEIKLMKHRLKNSAVLFSDSPDGTTYSITLPTSEHSQILPQELLGSVRVLLYIPAAYGAGASPRITIPDADDISARNVEHNFNQKADDVKGASWSLLALLNYLSTEVENLILPSKEEVTTTASSVPTPQNGKVVEQESSTGLLQQPTPLSEEEKEQILGQAGGSPSSVPPSALETEKSPEEEKEDEEVSYLELPPLSPRGTALYLPSIKLGNIDFLECQSLNMVIKCTRCKTYNDLMNVASAPYGRESKPVGVHCSKCNQTLAAAFRKDIIHASNDRAGFLDLHGCTPFEMLANCAFVPTCSNCSTTFPSSFRKMEVAKTLYENCRECHTRMTMYIPEFNFKYMSDDGIGDERLKLRANKKVKKENLGITGGTPLPNDGTCSHYRKSTRWFRFSCCSKVFVCDRCHDEQSDHPNERAQRMICGKCSREQNFSDICAFCRHSFAMRRSAFWEGGKGTRDPVKMSRKDPRKYKHSSNKKKT